MKAFAQITFFLLALVIIFLNLQIDILKIMLTISLSTAFILAAFHPEAGQLRMVAELARKGLFEIDSPCYMIDSKGESHDLSSICNRTSLPQRSVTDDESPIRTKIWRSGEKLVPRKQERLNNQKEF